VRLVFVDATRGGVPVPKGAKAVTLADLLANGLADGDALLVYAPAPGWDGEAALVGLLASSDARAIVVRAERADGFTPDPLAAASTGLIAGFGQAGLAEAVAFLKKR